MLSYKVDLTKHSATLCITFYEIIEQSRPKRTLFCKDKDRACKY